MLLFHDLRISLHKLVADVSIVLQWSSDLGSWSDEIIYVSRSRFLRTKGQNRVNLLWKILNWSINYMGKTCLIARNQTSHVICISLTYKA